ncbi:hypothetical protein SDC9_112744 [bioreactor metagenome]|uniref:Uncharacterized protein n=1 Tax=bioreactor metagenome TaxID=1076179 RepID=A0A645BK51_9ZZZZ
MKKDVEAGENIGMVVITNEKSVLMKAPLKTRKGFKDKGLMHFIKEAF